MRLSAKAVDRPITTFMVFLAIVTLGVVSYRQLPVQLLPDITFPVVGVYVSNRASATENINKFTRPIEGIVAEMPRVKNIRTSTHANHVWLNVQFEHGTDIQYSLVDLEERLTAFRNSLDDRRVYITAYPFSTVEWQSTFMYLSIRGPDDAESLFRSAGERVEEQLKAISGVSAVNIYGLRSSAAEVELNPDQMASYGLDISQVIGRVQAAVSDDSYLGRLLIPGETHYARLDNRVRTIDELADLYVDGKGIVRLRDVSLIYAGGTASENISRSNGRYSIDIELEREASRNLVDLARETRLRVAEINHQLPPGLELVITTDFAEYVEDAIAQVRKLALIGACLALLVPLVFFRSLRVSLIVFISVPISLIAVFNLFYAVGMSINIFSIVGLALGVGMLVDNSIVVVENSFRLYNKGKSPAEAARQGGSDVGRGLLAATLTTAIAFLPIAFLEGEFKLVVKEPALALVFPLFMSLLVALTLVPVMTWMILRTKQRKKKPEIRRGVLYKPFRRILKSALRYRGRVIFVIIVVITFTWLESCQRVRETATSERGQWQIIYVYIESVLGGSLSDMDRNVRVVEERLALHPDIDTFRVSFDRNRGTARISLKPQKEREDRASIDDVRGTMIDFIGPVSGLELSLERRDRPADPALFRPGNIGSIELKGLDHDIIAAYAERLMDTLRNHPDITLVELREERGNPLMLARIDRERTRLFDVKAEGLARYVGATRSGGTVSSLQLVDGENRTDVSFTIEGTGAQQTLDDIRDMSVYTRRGAVPFGELTRFQASREISRIGRINRQASSELLYHYHRDTNSSRLMEDVKKLMQTVPNPGGVVGEFSGEEGQIQQRRNDALFTAIWAAILVWVVMAAVFESFWVPLTILATNPLMLIGIVWGLDIAGLPMDDLAFFGIILLIGLAVNNGIVMLDRALSLQRSGFSRTRAVFDAAVTRLRPILMTFFTTALGLLPLALHGEEGDQWRPVAVVVIGGLTSATLLTLIVLPCFYVIGDDFVRWARPGFMAVLRTLFEIPEGIGRLVFHPIRVLRGELPFLPSLRSLIVSLWRFATESLRAPLKAVLCLPADMLFAIFPGVRLRRALRRGSPRFPRLYRVAHLLTIPLLLLWRLARWVVRIALYPFRAVAVRIYRRIRPAAAVAGIAATPAPVASGNGVIVQITNVQVIFPPTGLRRLRTALPSRLPGSLPPSQGAVHALHGASFEIGPGLFGLLGPNGAGKTTLLRALTGLLEPTRGTVRIYGVPHREAPGQLAPLFGYLPQTHGHYGWMTLHQYLHFFALLTARTTARARALGGAHPRLITHLDSLARLEDPVSREGAIQRVAAEVNLGDRLHDRIDTFSGGMKQRAGIARVLLQAPPILIVDEPTAGLDPMERMRIRVLLARLSRQHLVLLSTHIVEDLEQGCDRLAVLDRGRVVFLGTPDELKARPAAPIWEILVEPEEAPKFQEGILHQGGRVVARFLRDGKEGFRVASVAPPVPGALRTDPSLEEALLETLGKARVSP